MNSNLRNRLLMAVVLATSAPLVFSSTAAMAQGYGHQQEKGTKTDKEYKQILVQISAEKSEVAKQYGVSGIPQTVVIGKDGKVKKVFIGSGNEANIRRAVEGALAE